jgi:hypothetical protein
LQEAYEEVDAPRNDDFPVAGDYRELRQFYRKLKSDYGGLGGNNLFRPGNVLHLGAPFAPFLWLD